MLEKAGSKLYIAGEYAILRPNSYSLISYIPKYTYLEIKDNNGNIEILSSIEDKDNLILRLIYFLEERYKLKFRYMYQYTTELYTHGEKLGLGSSASIIVVTIKSILNKNNINFTKLDIFNIAVDFMIKEDISGSFGDLACICFEDTILFKSSNRISKNYEIEVLDIYTNILIEAIWTGNSASTSKLIKKINIDDKFFVEFSSKSNILVKKLVDEFLNNNFENVKNIIKNLSDNLKKLDDKYMIGIYSDGIKNKLREYETSKISGAGGGDYILSLKKNINKLKLKVNLEEK